MRFILPLMFVSFLQSGCLTLSKSERDATARPVSSSVKPKKLSANVNFALESVNWSGNRTIFAPDQAERLRSEFIDVLKEFGINEAAGPTTPSDLKINARLTIKDVGCETLFVESNCWLTLFISPVSLYIVPTSYRAEHEISLGVGVPGHTTTEVVRSASTVTHIHLLLVPLLPLELYNLLKADFRTDLYRSMLQAQLNSSPLTH